MVRSARVFLLLSFTLSFVGCESISNVAPSIGGTAGSNPAPAIWAVSWGNSPGSANQTATNPGGSEQSFRMIFRPTLSGTQERLHFSNFFGTAPVTIGSARLAISPNGTAAIDPANDVAVTFNGASSVTIPAGAVITSDSVKLNYSFGQRLAVSMYVKGTFGPLTQHISQGPQGFESPVNAGDTTGDAGGASFSLPNSEWFLLSGMDVFGAYQGTVVLFGSSTTDGFHSDFGDTNAYPTANVAVPGQDGDLPSDWLAGRLQAAGYQLGVLNAGIIADPIQDGIDRLNRDVLQQSNVKAVVVYFGLVDIRSTACTSAPPIESSLSQIISMSATAGLRVVVATLAPSAFCSTPGSPNFGPVPSPSDPYAGEGDPPTNGGMVQRNLANVWIRTTAAKLPGVVGIADYDKALADQVNPDFMIPGLNSGDNFHPNGVGYGVQTEAIPLDVLLPPASQ